jgi:hypothetical protein
MEKVYLERRLTHRYVGTYRHLDRWRSLGGVARITPYREVDAGNGYDEGGTYVRWATLPRGVDRDAACRALEDALSRWGCAHEYDCCGCASYTTRVQHRHGRRVVLKTRVSYNY